MTGANIHSVDNTTIAGSANTATMGLGKYSRIYYCLAAGQAVYVSLFLSNRSSKWPIYVRHVFLIIAYKLQYVCTVVSEAAMTMSALLTEAHWA